MNEQTTSLLRELASKLGTTAQNLWAILLHQAPIDATITLIQCIVLIAFPIVLYRVHLKLLVEDDTNYQYDKYENNDAYAPIMIFLAIGAFAGLILVVCSFNEIFNGYFNPQYWALEQILETIKK